MLVNYLAMLVLPKRPRKIPCLRVADVYTGQVQPCRGRTSCTTTDYTELHILASAAILPRYFILNFSCNLGLYIGSNL